MLEKFFDAHLHLNAENLNSENKSASNFYSGCISLHEDDNPVLKQGYIFSYGVHPLNPDKKFLYKLEELLSNQNKIILISFNFHTNNRFNIIIKTS